MTKRIISIVLLLVTLLSLLPASSALAAGRTFKVNTEVELDSKGRTVVSWKDSSKGAPYKVYYICVSKGSATQTSWIGAERVGSKKTVLHLAPGLKYKITVEDKNGDTASATITVPRKKNVTSSRPRTETIGLSYKKDKYVEDKDAKVVKKDDRNAEHLEKLVKKGYEVGFYYITNNKSTIKKAIKHYAIFVLTAPNGYVATEYDKNFLIQRRAGVYYYGQIGGSFFKYLYEHNDYIPSGTYKFQVFLEGRLYLEKKYTLDSY